MTFRYPLAIPVTHTRERVADYWESTLDIDIYESGGAAVEATGCGATYRDNGHDRAVLSCIRHDCPMLCSINLKGQTLPELAATLTDRTDCPDGTWEADR